MSLTEVEIHDGVAVLKMNNGITNAISPGMVEELPGKLRELEEDPSVKSLVMTSTNNKFFSIGLDIPHLFDLTREEFGAFYNAFNRVCLDLFTFTKPTVAAITGHAIAAGCIVATCCDYRFIADGRKLMGINEVKLGVPVPYPADCILRHIIGDRNAREMGETGDLYPPDKSLEMGLVDRVLPPEDVLKESLERAGTLGALPQGASGMIKQNRVERVEAQILEQLTMKEDFFIECWYSPGTRDLLRKAMKSF